MAIFDDARSAFEKTGNAVENAISVVRMLFDGSKDEDVSVDISGAHEDRQLPNGNRFYDGPLGRFEYDPKQFRLEDYPEGSSDSKIRILKFVGKNDRGESETDGRNIHIPEGLQYAPLMFANSDIKVAPKLPSSLKSCFGMFYKCSELEDASLANLSSTNVQDTRFMFGDCSSLKYAPLNLGNSVSDARYMFVGCESLEKSPRLSSVLRHADGMFGNCEKLRDMPKVPISVRTDENMFFGCDFGKNGGSAVSLVGNRSEKDGDRLNRKTFGERVGSAFSVFMHALATKNNLDCKFMEALKIAREGQKSGRLGSSVYDGVLEWTASFSGDMSSWVSSRLQSSVDKVFQRSEENRVNRDAVRSHGYDTGKDIRFATRARRDFENGVFDKLSSCNAKELEELKVRFEGSHALRRDLTDRVTGLVGQNNIISDISKKAIASYYMKELSAISSYKGEATLCAREKTGSFGTNVSSDFWELEQNINMVAGWQSESLLRSAKAMQEKYSIFSNEQLVQLQSLAGYLVPDLVESDDTFVFSDGLELGALSGRKETMEYYDSVLASMSGKNNESSVDGSTGKDDVEEQSVDVSDDLSDDDLSNDDLSDDDLSDDHSSGDVDEDDDDKDDDSISSEDERIAEEMSDPDKAEGAYLALKRSMLNDFDYSETASDNGFIHYKGPLGEFDYDPNQFRLITIPDGLGEDFSMDGLHMQVLHYEGEETDGSKIEIPRGCKDCTCMFAKTKISSTPVLPEGITSGLAMFAKCDFLETANSRIPSSMNETAYMYMDCKNLKIGPGVIPGNVLDAEGMFMNCSNMMSTPRIRDGVKNVSYIFANCERLRKKPDWPRSIEKDVGATSGCIGIDEAEIEKESRRIAKERDKYERKLNRKPFGSNLTSGFSLAMQVHALKQSGMGFGGALLMSSMMRKQNVLGKHLSDGIYAGFLSNRKGGSLVSMLMMTAVRRGASHEMKKNEANMAKLRRYDTLSTVGLGTKSDIKVAGRAAKDAANNVFIAAAGYGPNRCREFSSRYADKFSKIYAMLTKHAGTVSDGRGGRSSEASCSRDVKRKVSKAYIEQLSNIVSYYSEGMEYVSDGRVVKGSQQELMEKGLNRLTELKYKEWLASVQKAQADHGIFNDGDMRVIDQMLSKIPCARGFSFRETYATDERQRMFSMYSHMANHGYSRRDGFGDRFDAEDDSHDTDGPAY